jgi:hypothetical protein
VDDLRWFASDLYTALIVPELRRLGLSIATEGERPARLAVAMSGHTAVRGWRFARRRGARLLLYLWDLPPGGMGRGRPDPVWWVAGRFLRIPRPWGGYGRGAYFSRLYYIARRAEAAWGRFEGFGLTPIEAVASGVPVIASDIPPHREFVGRAARFVPPDDPVALARAITEALDAGPADPALVADLTIQAAAARFLASLQRLLSK